MRYMLVWNQNQSNTGFSIDTKRCMDLRSYFYVCIFFSNATCSILQLIRYSSKTNGTLRETLNWTEQVVSRFLLISLWLPWLHVCGRCDGTVAPVALSLLSNQRAAQVALNTTFACAWTRHCPFINVDQHCRRTVGGPSTASPKRG